MLHKRSAALILSLALPALAGCAQTTRHSNTMIFGTNTSLAARVGQSVNQVPEISVGYARQEAVIMPLLANTEDRGGEFGLLSPCGTTVPIGKPPRATQSTLSSSDGKPHPCMFVATRTGDDGIVTQDSYSVLASFGANIKARSPAPNSPGGDIGVGLAQYFATGVAAQLLAANGGAAVVSVGQGARESAESTRTGAATSAVTGNAAQSILEVEPTPEQTGIFLAQYDAFKANMAKAQTLTSSAAWPTQWSVFVAATGINNRACTDQADCIAKFSGAGATPFRSVFGGNTARFVNAANVWCKSVSQNPGQDCPAAQGGS